MSNPQSHFNSPCAACKFLRRKCVPECIFAPYFSPDQPQKFAVVHRIYGASNVAKMLGDVSHDHREDAVNSLVYEAKARLRDPVYGCVGSLSVLQRKLKRLQTDLFVATQELSTYLGPQAMAPILQQHALASSSSSLNEIPLHNPQPMAVVAPQFLTQQSLAPREDQSHDMFVVNGGMEGFNNDNKNNLAGFVDPYRYNPMMMMMAPSEPLSPPFESHDYQIQPQSEGQTSSLRNIHPLQQQYCLVQTQPATAEQQTQQPPPSQLIQDAAESIT